MLNPMRHVVISLLRGVNVGGHNKIRMETLRALYAGLGLGDVQTYLQSGNVLFTTDKRSLDGLAREIEDALERECGFRPSVIQRTAAGLGEVVRNNPFANRTDVEPAKLAVIFLARDPGEAARNKVLAMQIAPEELVFGSREYYVHFPHGMGRTKFPYAAVDRALGTPGTGRNWNSVTNLLKMAEKLEAAR